MLKSLELENFKAFGERVKIPFAPITLIFGENSSGKSSILQSLNLLKQTRESREVGALLLPRTEQGISDLGSFQDLLFDHDLSKSLVIKIVLNTEDNESIQEFLYCKDVFPDAPAMENAKDAGLEFKFSRPSLEREISLTDVEAFLNGDCIIRFKHTGTIPSEVWDNIGYPIEGEPLDEILNHKEDIPFLTVDWVTNELKIWKPRFEFFKKNKYKILKMLEKLLLEKQEQIKSYQKYLENESHEQQRQAMFSFFISSKQHELSNAEEEENSLKETIDFYSSNFDQQTFISRIHCEYKGESIELGGFLPVLVLDKAREFHEETFIKRLKEYRYTNKRNRKFNPDFSGLAIVLGKLLEETLQKVFPLGPLRKPPERWYIFTGTSPKDVGYKGDMLPSLLFRNANLVEKANNWLKNLNIGYQIKVESLGERLKDLFEVKLVDIRRSKPIEIGLSDVGFGLSQLLPFIVQSLASTEKIISIEQPEVHVHPKLQADLGDLLAETIKPPYNNQFIIETHSEHLVLRLQKLVSEKKLSPNDVSIIYVSRGANGSKVQQLQLDEDGDFIDDWPGGFFPERLRELR